jgi:DNA-binding MarR family transcriptional regulator
MTRQKWRDAVPNDRIAHQLRDAFRAMSRAMRDRLTDSDIPYGFWTFLRILWEKDGITQRDLSVMAGVKDPTTHSALVAMEKAGLIVRVKLLENKRTVYVYVSPKGRELKRKLIPLAVQVNSEALRGVSQKNVLVFRSVLRAIVHNLGGSHEDDAAVEQGEQVEPVRVGGRLRV